MRAKLVYLEFSVDIGDYSIKGKDELSEQLMSKNKYSFDESF